MNAHLLKPAAAIAVICATFALGNADAAPVTLENDSLRVSVVPGSGLTTVLDKQADVLWRMDPAEKAAGYLRVINRNDFSWMKEVLPDEKGTDVFREELLITIGPGDGDEEIVFENPPETGTADDYRFIRLKAPITSLRATDLTLEYRLADSAPDIEFLAMIDGPQRFLVKEVAFPTGFSVEPDEKGYLVVPHWVGLIIPNGLYEFDVNRRVYQGSGQEAYNMRFTGAAKQTGKDARSAFVVPFESLYTKINMKSRDGRVSATPRLFRVNRALDDWKKQYRFRYHFIPGGTYVDIAKYYRQWSMEHGLFRSYRDKVADHPQIAEMFLPSGGGGGGFLFFQRDFHFRKLTERIAQLKAAGVEKANFMLYGWGGDYHRTPDVLPANEEYGGNEALIELSEAAREAGYDITMNDIIIGSTEAAPSHSEQFLARQQNGAPYFCGTWGTDAYIINAEWQYKFIEDHLPKIIELFHPSRYYYDGQTNMPPFDDFSPEHPQTFDDDLYWRGRIFELTHRYVGVLGSESPNDWAVPYLDWTYDGRDGYDLDEGQYSDDLKGFITPLWHLVYHDALLPRQGYRANYRSNDQFEIAVRSFLKSVRAGTFVHIPGAAGGGGDGNVLRKLTAGKRAHRRDGLKQWDDLSPEHSRDIVHAATQPFLKRIFYEPMTDHRFLSDDYFVEFSQFGDDVKVYVNGSGEPFKLSKDTTLAPYGFLIAFPTHEAYAAVKMHGRSISSPLLAVATSRDGQPLDESGEVEVVCGFGEGSVPLKNGHARATLDDGTVLKPGRDGIFSIPAKPMTPLTVRFSEK